MDALPEGTLTFLFTDIEGSTRLLEHLGEQRYAECLGRHDDIIRSSVESHDGVVVRTVGDGFFAVFIDAVEAVEAAGQAQRTLVDTVWPEGVTIRVRMGLHTGRGHLAGDDYVGLDVHRAARIGDAGHGGQIVVSGATAALVEHRLEAGLDLRDLGLHRLRDVSDPEHLFQVDLDGRPSSFPALRTASFRPSHLPEELTSFIGRTAELDQARRLLEDGRLVTLTGPGGTGKTRLATRLASELASSFRNGAHFVPIESIVDPELVAPAILEVLGLHAMPGTAPADHLANWLSTRELLLVLDNFEQVPGAAPLVGRLLAEASDLRVVVTSRAPLHIRGEQELPVPPLGAPITGEPADPTRLAEMESVRLFVDRASAIRPDFQLNADTAPAVATLAARLDGLPLAIELAASRVKLLSVDAIVDRLDNRLLQQGSSDLPARQQTITNAIGWSYDLLDAPARILFERCAVFVGDARLEEIEAVCGPTEELDGDLLDALSVLVDQSLIQRSDADVEPRFRLLAVVREFAHGALVARGADEEMRARHARAYASIAERAAPYLLTSRHQVWMERLTADHDNLRAALDWAVETSDGDLACGLVGDLWRFWQTQGHLNEAATRIAAALALPGATPRRRAMALEAQGGVRYWQGDWTGALEPYLEALRLMREHGDDSDVANALYNAAFSVGYAVDRDEAKAMLDEALGLYEAAGDQRGIGRVYWGLCDLASYAADYDAVAELATRSAEVLETVDAPFDTSWAWFMRAQANYRRGQSEQGAADLQRALPHFLETRDLSGLMLVLGLSAVVTAGAGNPVMGARILGAADALANRIGAGIASVDVNQYPALQELRPGADPDIRRAREEGLNLTTEEAIALVLDVL